MTKFGRFRWAIWCGWAITIAGTGMLVLLDVHIRTYAWILIFVVVGLGHGLIAAAMYTFTRTFGMCIGVAIGGAVFQNQLKKHLVDQGLLTSVATDAEGFVVNLKALAKTSPQYQNYTLAYAKSFENVFEVLTALAGLAGLLSLLIKEFSMDKELDSEHVLRQGKKGTAALESSPNAIETSTSEAIHEAEEKSAPQDLSGGNAGSEEKQG